VAACYQKAMRTEKGNMAQAGLGRMSELTVKSFFGHTGR
jgi:hypothetical protein